jgi:hypothetical protein
MVLPDVKCDAVCAKMDGLLFPYSFCEDLNAYRADAYFCGTRLRLENDTCPAFCERAVAAAPNERCRAALGEVGTCVRESPGYADWVLSSFARGGVAEACQMAILGMMSSCWAIEDNQRHRMHWTQNRPAAYRFHYEEAVGETRDTTASADVTVVGSQPVANDGGRAITMDDLFDAADDCLSRPNQSVTVIYDAAGLAFSDLICETSSPQPRTDPPGWPGFRTVRGFFVSGFEPL